MEEDEVFLAYPEELDSSVLPEVDLAAEVDAFDVDFEDAALLLGAELWLASEL